MARILIIEDEALVRLTLRQILEKAGYEVMEATDGNEGIELYKQMPTDLIITDIIMPGKEGIETIVEIRRYRPDAKIIAISGGGQLGGTYYLESARRFGTEHVFQKPVDRLELLQAVEHSLKPGAGGAQPQPV